MQTISFSYKCKNNVQELKQKLHSKHDHTKDVKLGLL